MSSSDYDSVILIGVPLIDGPQTVGQKASTMQNRTRREAVVIEFGKGHHSASTPYSKFLIPPYVRFFDWSDLRLEKT
jgi:hypothetical protein